MAKVRLKTEPNNALMVGIVRNLVKKTNNQLSKELDISPIHLSRVISGSLPLSKKVARKLVVVIDRFISQYGDDEPDWFDFQLRSLRRMRRELRKVNVSQGRRRELRD